MISSASVSNSSLLLKSSYISRLSYWLILYATNSVLPIDKVKPCLKEVLRVGSLIRKVPPVPDTEWTVTPAPIIWSIGSISSPMLNLDVFADPTNILVVPALTNTLVVVNPATNVVLCIFNPVFPIPVCTLTSSPGMNPLTVDPIPTFVTLRILVSKSQDLTLASVLDVWPTTKSLYSKLPRPVIMFGSATVTVGTTVYPIPGFPERTVCNVVFDASITDTGTAVVPVPGLATVTVGGTVYPLPFPVTVYDITPFCTVSIPQVAIAPLPPPPSILMLGAILYAAPAFVKINS